MCFLGTIRTEIVDTGTATISVVGLIPTPNHGDLLALADVEVTFDGVSVVVHGVQLRADGKRTEVRLPQYRAPDGAWKAAISLPDEVRGPMGDAVIAAGLELGLLRERVAES